MATDTSRISSAGGAPAKNGESTNGIGEPIPDASGISTDTGIGADSGKPSGDAGDHGAPTSRGRKKRVQAESAQTSLGLENTPPVEAPKEAPKRTARKQARTLKDKGESQDAARGLMEMAELFAVARLGPAATFTPMERVLIEAPLGRLIERYGSLAEQYSALIDPAMVVVGILLYGIRLSGAASPAQPGPAEPGPVQPGPAEIESPAVNPTVDPSIADFFGGVLNR